MITGWPHTWYFEFDVVAGTSYLIQITHALEYCDAVALCARFEQKRRTNHFPVQGIDGGSITHAGCPDRLIVRRIKITGESHEESNSARTFDV